ncbi:hypothetical protein MKW98_003712 [Papaver atlanticum]|uniref:Uncharacterized protein n=1 Tax=Papaver atlanticum TaxID=357466 RepID=A0AAD4SIJ6_9MAGN|nr:hypothetical protein MKW98_003712 [Papaver atlanticum]
MISIIRYSPFSQMASIRDKLKMSFEEEERKSNAILRDKLIARTVKGRESTIEYLKALGEEPISYDSESMIGSLNPQSF